MIAVSDTSPLNYLILLGEVDLLRRLFVEVLIPPAVAAELAHPGSPGKGENLACRRATLASGRRRALALECNPDFVLLDDRAARGVALDLGLPVMGTLAVLRTGAQRGEIDLPSALARLSRTNFRASPELLSSVLQ